MSAPFLPADLQLDMGLAESPGNQPTRDKSVESASPELTASAGHQPSGAYFPPQKFSQSWTQTRKSPSPSRTRRGGDPCWDYSPVESGGLRGLSSPATYDGASDSRYRARFSESPDGPQTSEASLSSAIAAIAAAATRESPFPSFDAMSGGDGDGDFRVTVPGSATTLTGSPSKPTFSAASDSTAASPDLDVSALIRLLSPSAAGDCNAARAPHLQYGGACRSMQQFLSEAAVADGSSERTGSSGTFPEGGGLNGTPQGLSIPLLGMPSSRSLAQRTDRQPPHHQFASEAILLSSHKRSQEDVVIGDGLAPPSTLSCAELGRLTAKDDLADEQSDTVEPLNSFVRHALGSSKRRSYPLQPSHFQSPSSGTFLSKGYSQLDAHDALKELLDCFGNLPEQRGLTTPAAAAAAVLREHQVKLADSQNRHRSPLPVQCVAQPSFNSLTPSTEFGDHRGPWLHLAPAVPSIGSQGSLSPSNRSGLTFIGSQHQGSATAPAAMVTNSEGMLAALLASWRAAESTGELPTRMGQTRSEIHLHQDNQLNSVLSSDQIRPPDHPDDEPTPANPSSLRDDPTWSLPSHQPLTRQDFQSMNTLYSDCQPTDITTQNPLQETLPQPTSNESDLQRKKSSSAGSPSSSSRKISESVRNQSYSRVPPPTHHDEWTQDSYYPPPFQRSAPPQFPYYSGRGRPLEPQRHYEMGYDSDRLYDLLRARRIGMDQYNLPFYEEANSEYQRQQLQSARIGESCHSGSHPHYPFDSHPIHPQPSEAVFDGFAAVRPPNDGKVQRLYSDDRDRMVYVSWIPKKARAFNTIDKRRMELELKRKLREDLGLVKLTKVLLFPPKGVHCKLIFDSRYSAANFMASYGGDNRSVETERWKADLCGIYNIDMHEKFDKTVVKIEWSQK